MDKERNTVDFAALAVATTLFFREGALQTCLMMAEQGPVIRNQVKEMFSAEGIRVNAYILMPKLVKVGLVEKSPNDNSFKLTENGQKIIAALAS